MNRKRVFIAIGVAAVLAALFVFLSWRIALVIVAGLLFFGVLFTIFMLGLKGWTELEKKDPEKARKMWAEAMFEIEANRYRYML